MSGGDPHLRSLLLTGAFARGEGAVLDGLPQNDYDLVAVRGPGAPAVPYADLRAQLEGELGLHVDLAPVPAWRLRFVSPSIFWYETALKGKVLWGEDVLGRIRVRTPAAIGRREGLRLLVNRAAGLLLVTAKPEPHAVRIQASKALLAALDAQLLAAGVFPPSHTERWEALQRLRAEGRAPPGLQGDLGWYHWAFRFKVDPANAEARCADMAWRSARRAVLDAVPVALRHARLGTIEQYARKDGLVDHLVFAARARSLPGAKRFTRNPTGRVRLATLRILEASPDGRVPPAVARKWLGGLVDVREPVAALDAVRGATLQ